MHAIGTTAYLASNDFSGGGFGHLVNRDADGYYDFAGVVHFCGTDLAAWRTNTVTPPRSGAPRPALRPSSRRQP